MIVLQDLTGLCNVDALHMHHRLYIDHVLHVHILLSRKYAIQNFCHKSIRHLRTNIFEINSTLKRKTRVADPGPFGMDPDPRIRASD